MMMKFSDFMLLESENEYKFKAMRGSLTGADSYKTISHLKRYLMPFLSKEQAAETVKNMGKQIFDPEKTIDEHQPVQDLENRDHTHLLAKNHEGLKPGTPIKVLGAYENEGRIMVKTKDHGDIPMTKLDVPMDIRKSRSVKKAWNVENKIAERFGVKAAGSSKLFHDFSFPPQKPGEKVSKNKKLKGVVKVVDEPEEKNPFELKGETKGDNGVMGNAKYSFDPEKGWKVSHSNENLANVMASATVNNELTGGKDMNVIDYLNKHHSDGVIQKRIKAKAAAGTSKAYFESIGNNAVHIHDMKKDVGTTFTVGDELRGMTHLSHLDDDDVNLLDGDIDIGRTINGNSLGFHRPHRQNMRNLAELASKDPDRHASVEEESHANRVMEAINNLNKQKRSEIETVSSQQPQKRTLDHEATFAGKSYHSPDEQKQLSEGPN